METSTNLGVISGHDYLGSYGASYYYRSTGTFSWENSETEAENAGGYLYIENDLF